MNATCSVCDGPCHHEQWACWSTPESRVEFCCSERCLDRHDRLHSTDGDEYHQEEWL